MFRGQYEHTVDAKGRTSFPSRFREALNERGETRLVVTTSLENCLVAYPMREWLAFEERLSKLPQFDSNVAMLKRIYVSGAVECDLDRLGRIIVPASLRQYAKFEREIIWAGMGSNIELWSKQSFHSLRQKALSDEKQREQLSIRLAELGL